MKHTIKAFLLSGLLGSAAFAVNEITVEVTVTGSSPVTTFRNAGADITITLGSVSANTLVRIFDNTVSGGAPAYSVGKVTIDGTVSSGTPILRVLVVGANQSTIPSDFGDFLDQGLINLGGSGTGAGIKVYNSGDGGDTTLRDRTRVAIGISGDITGDMHVAEVFRVQSDDDVLANIRASGTLRFATGFDPITRVVAGDSVAGTITATLGDIDRVQVGPNTAATGITGGIIAEAGAINSIFSTGPIGTSTVAAVIKAANGIGQIRTAASGTATLLVRSVHAEVVSNQAMLDDPDIFYSGPGADGALTLLEIGGDLHGIVDVGNIAIANGLDVPSGRRGIFIEGICFAPINVALTIQSSNIVARTFTKPIDVGYSMTGTVVATGGAETPAEPPEGYADGRIPKVTIGRGDLSTNARATYEAYPSGLIGSFPTRTIPTDPEDWFLRSSTLSTLDSVIHAEASIGTADITGLTSAGISKYPPAVEAPLIGALRIDSLAYGVVWSGQFDSGDENLSFAVIDEFSAGCIRQTGTVWMKDWTKADVDTDVFGDIHVPEIKSDQLLRIGRIFGDEGAATSEDTPVEQACDCTTQAFGTCQDWDWIWNNLHNSQTLDNPRNPWWPAYLPDSDTNGRLEPDRRGQIWIHETEGLEGQIIINAENNTTLSPSLLWSGAVQVGIGTNGFPLIEVSSSPSTGDWTAPHYDGLPAALGGGAIGLVPFALHRTACDPPADSDLEDYRTFTSSEFAGLLEPGIERRVITKVFYGWVGANHTTHHPVTAYNGVWTTERGKWMNIDIDQDSTDPRSREVTVTGNGVQYLLPGLYEIEPVTTASTPDALTPMVCIGTFGTGSSAPLVADFTYEFALTPDCDGNGQDDAAQIALDQTLDLWPFDGLLDYCYWSICDGDVNCDMALNGLDIEIQELAIGNDLTDYCPDRDPDFNRDFAVNGTDVEAVEFAVGNGFCDF